jgi:hypothetical protein
MIERTNSSNSERFVPPTHLTLSASFARSRPVPKELLLAIGELLPDWPLFVATAWPVHVQRIACI